MAKGTCTGCGGTFSAQTLHADMDGNLWHESCRILAQGLTCTKTILCAWCEADSDTIHSIVRNDPEARLHVHAKCYERMQ